MAAAESAPSGCDPDCGLRRDLPPGRRDDRRSWRKYGSHGSDRETAGAYFYRIRDTTAISSPGAEEGRWAPLAANHHHREGTMKNAIEVGLIVGALWLPGAGAGAA